MFFVLFLESWTALRHTFPIPYSIEVTSSLNISQSPYRGRRLWRKRIQTFYFNWILITNFQVIYKRKERCLEKKSEEGVGEEDDNNNHICRISKTYNQDTFLQFPKHIILPWKELSLPHSHSQEKKTKVWKRTHRFGKSSLNTCFQTFYTENRSHFSIV